MKRILTIQDFSCLGKCSTTVALPTISALGIEVVALPTTILSCHTGFDEYEIIHIEDRLHNMTKCWDKENIKFDGIYIGYLGNVQAIIETEKIIKKYSNEKALVMIDPVLGDGGMLYDGFDNEVGKYTGNDLSSKTVTVLGDTVRIRLITNGVFTEYGFAVEDIKVNY